MRIAVLGWGSLIWCPRELDVTTRWRPGPELPVEFARQSSGGRVTLVLLQNYEVSRAFWARSSLSDIQGACENLRRREGCKPGDIHFTTGAGLRIWRDEEPSSLSTDVSSMVEEWLKQVADLDAAVWTGLPPKGFERYRPADLASDVVTYLQERGEEEQDRAQEYVQFAPSTVRTPVREAIEEPPLRWSQKRLPDSLFEDRE